MYIYITVTIIMLKVTLCHVVVLCLIRIIDSSTVFTLGTGFHWNTHSYHCSYLPRLQIVQAATEEDSKVSFNL